MVKIFNSGGQIGCNVYGASNQRLQYMEGATTTYYAWAGSNVVAEYFPSGTNALQWNKSYVYLGGRLLATATNNAGTATTQFQHPDRLGTRLTTDTNGTLLSENVNLPFGTSMPNATSLNGSGQPTLGEGYLPSGATQSTKKRFTSYDRSDMTGLDYAVNRHYSATQGRFTQVDPIGMAAVSLSDPQSLNLYAYCGNDPINQIDPDGLFSWKKLFGFFSKALKIVLIVGLIVGAVLLGGAFIAIKLGIEAGGWFGSAFLGFMHGIGAAMGWASPSVVFSLAATGSAAAWAGAGIWAFGVMAGIGAVAAFTYNPQKAKQGKKAKTPVDNGGQFSPDKLAILNGVIDATREKLKDENCAAALGGKANAEKLLNRARPLSGNTINPEYKGTGGIATRGELPGETVAGTARRKALDPNSNNLAYSEVGGRHIYIQDRFFDITSQSGQITLYIHELNRLNGYSGGDKEDYARITKACGTEEPIRK